MLKKSLILSFIALGLSGCTPTYEQYAKYKISDNDMKQVIANYKPILHCIYPQTVGKSHDEVYNLIYRRVSDAENQGWNNLISNSYIGVIGKRDAETVFLDKNSRIYSQNKWVKLYSSVSPANNDYLKCGQKEKKHFQSEIAKLEKELNKQKTEQARKEKIAKAKAEKERKEREAFYKTPQGRIVKAQEDMAEAQWAVAQAQQQAAYAQEQAAYAAERRAKQAENAAFWNNINNSIKSNTPRYTTCYGNAYGNQATCWGY